MLNDFNSFEVLIRQRKPAIVTKLMVTKYGAKSESAADDAQYKREIEVAVDAAVEVLREYRQWASSR